MNLINDSLQIFPEWNKTHISLARCYEYCYDKEIVVVMTDNSSVPFGCYMVRNGRDVIIINKELEPIMLLWVFLHEIFHQKWHHPDSHFFHHSIECKYDSAANFFAAVAVLPKPMIAGMTREDVYRHYNAPWDLILLRHELAINEAI